MRAGWWVGWLVALGCGGPVEVPPAPEVSGPTSTFVIGPEAGFWDAPFPAEHRRHADGTVDVSGFPNPGEVELVRRLVAQLDGVATGFAQSSAIYLPFEASLAEVALPGPQELRSVQSLAFLVDVDPASPERGAVHPISLAAVDGEGPYEAAHALVMLPLQGLPLRPATRYAAAVRRAILPNAPLAASETLAALVAGAAPYGWSEAQAAPWLESLDALEELGVEPSRLGALTVFTTEDATAATQALYAAGADQGFALRTPLALGELADDYCVYEATVTVPVYQRGEPPFLSEGGGVVWEGGAPVVQGSETSRLFLTVPRRVRQGAGWPVAVFARTGGGGDRPLIDRGPRDAEGFAEPGTGFAVEFARAGVVGVQVDGPLGGLRNPDGADEQFAIFNVTNPEAMRGNLQQSAVELAWLPDLLEGLLLDLSDCPGAQGPQRLDTSRLLLFGHSMGATIAPVSAALQPRYEALVLSGAGGSWIYNVVWKEKPLEVRGVAALILGEPEAAIDPWHPALTLLQWAGEGADPPLYGPALRAHGGRHVLMLQGLIDRYILPPIAQATALALHLDLGGDQLDQVHAPQFAPYADVMGWVGAQAVALPASLGQGSEAQPRTALVVQHLEDGVEDGHEVAYQLPEARLQVQCFVQSWAAGEPVVVDRGAEGCAD